MVADDTIPLAVWFERGRVQLRHDLPAPVPGPDEVRVRVRLAGICGTDLQLLAGYADFRGIAGHEFVGEVVAGDPAWIGRRVVAEINIGCGHCGACDEECRSHCERRRVVGIRGHAGAFASSLCLPTANLHEVPATMDDEVAVFTEPLAAACRVVEQLPDLAGRRVVVFGAGKLGQLVARVLALQPCEVTVATRRERQRSLLPQGVTAVLPDAVPERAFDVAVDCTGHPDGAEASRRCLRPRGTLVLKSTHTGEPRLDLNALVVDEMAVIGSRCGPFAAALRLLQSGHVDPRPLIDRVLPLQAADEGLRAAATPGALKVLLRP